MMDNKVLAAIIAGLVLLCGTAVGVALIVTGGDDSAPAPVSTSAPAPTPEDTSDPVMDILNEVWNAQSYSDQKDMCLYFNVDPDGAFTAFDSGSKGLVPKDTFMEFFSIECSSIT